MSSNPPDQEYRDLIIHELDRTMLVEAAAGTGKTTAMLNRMVALLETGRCEVDTLAAVTFTRKAAAEIRSRFQVRLEAAVRSSKAEARGRLVAALEHIDRCSIGTIHAFCARLLRERPIEAGIDIGFEEIDEEADARLRKDAWREYVDSLMAADEPILSELEDVGLQISTTTKWRGGLAQELEEVGLDVAQLGPAYMRRADFPDVDEWPTPAAALPDLTEAIIDLRAYVAEMAKLVPTFETIGHDQLMPKYEQLARSVKFFNLERPVELMRILELFREFKRTHLVQKNWPGKGEQAIAELARWNEFNAKHAQPLLRNWREHRYGVVMRAIGPAIDVYDRLRRENNQLNFQDLLLNAARLLRTQPQIRSYFRQRFTHLMIDEFQDTDPLQAEVMFLLTADNPQETDWRKCSPVPGALFVVGDPKQSIYRFRRADIVTYRKVKQIIAQNDGLIVPLAANFRSTRQLIEWVNRRFMNVFAQQETDQVPERRDLMVGREGTAVGKLAGLKSLSVPGEIKRRGEAAEYEAGVIARYIRQALDEGWQVPSESGTPRPAVPGDFLIITRFKSNLSGYGRKLQELGIPHQVTGGSSVNQVGELTLLQQCLKSIVRPDDPIALLAVLRSELFGVSDQALYAFKKAGGRFSFRSQVPKGLPESDTAALTETFERLQCYQRWLRQQPVLSAVERILADLGLTARSATTADGATQAGSLMKSIELLRAAGGRGWSTEELVDYLEELTTYGETHDGLPVLPEKQAPVRIMNLHKAKGLEAPVVFLADVRAESLHDVVAYIDRSGDKTRGFLPIYGLKQYEFGPVPLLAHPVDWDEYAQRELSFLEAENDRLLYVAATRAGSQLIVTSWEGKPGSWKLGDSADFERLELPEQSEPTPVVEGTHEFEDPTAASTAIAERWRRACQPTYDVVAAKGYALPSGVKPHATGEHGVEWGTVIHTMLEAAMAKPACDLRRLAVSTLECHGLQQQPLVEAVLETVDAVMKSELWSRARASQKCLVEVPFTTLLPMVSPETVMRGVIDLAFLEPRGWVIADYKTDRVEAAAIPDLVKYYQRQVQIYAEHWGRMVRQDVHELGLFFTHLNMYVTIASV